MLAIAGSPSDAKTLDTTKPALFLMQALLRLTGIVVRIGDLMRER